MGTRKNRLGEAVLTSTHNLCFEQKCDNIRFFFLKKIQFLVLKFSIYLNRRVFVMVHFVKETIINIKKNHHGSLN